MVRSLDDTDTDGDPPIRFTFGAFGLSGDISFSPDGDFLLCCTGSANEMQVLDLRTGTDAEWGSAFRSMALPVGGGVLNGRTLGWGRLARTRDGGSAKNKTKEPVVLYGAVGSKFTVTKAQPKSAPAHA